MPETATVTILAATKLLPSQTSIRHKKKTTLGPQRPRVVFFFLYIGVLRKQIYLSKR